MELIASKIKNNKISLSENHKCYFLNCQHAKLKINHEIKINNFFFNFWFNEAFAFQANFCLLLFFLHAKQNREVLKFLFKSENEREM
jgi:hypothetical protein